MGNEDILIDILAILAAAVVIVPVFKRFRIGSILGYLVAGVFLGPWGLAIITNIEEMQQIAEFGVVFLLFIIGIELKPSRLWLMRHTIFGLGLAQVLITGSLISSIALLFNQPLTISIIIGFGLSLSSTAFGLQILTEKSQLGSHSGRNAFSVLLFQDLAAIPLLMLVSFFAKESSIVQGIELAILETLVTIAAIFLVGRFLINPILHQVASSNNSELFTAATLLLILGISWLTDQVGLSMALGAFLAGLMLADSNYRHQIVADIQPFRGILLGLFFMGVGMSINFGLLKTSWALVLLLVFSLIIIKIIVLWALCRVLKANNNDSIHTSLILSQSGEFGFVIFSLAAMNGVITSDLYQILALIIALTMVTTPLMAYISQRFTIHPYMKDNPHHIRDRDQDSDNRFIIIAGFGRVGRRVAKTLKEADTKYLALDRNPERVAWARKNKFDVFYGDILRGNVLKAVGIDNASMIVIALDNPKHIKHLVKIIRQRYPDIPILARAKDRKHSEELRELGVSIAISELFETGLQLGSAVLEAKGIEESEIQNLLHNIRESYYKKNKFD